MPHVAEGELHAWLDGALDQLGAARAAQVREHLRSCAACREALVVEEAFRARAADVLALAAPATVELPPFEALLERARAVQGEGTGTRLRISRTARLGWAASVVIALGAGYMARELGLRPGAEREEARADGLAPSLAREEEPTTTAPVEAEQGGPDQPGEAVERSRGVSAPPALRVETQGVPAAAPVSDELESANAGLAKAAPTALGDVKSAPISGGVRTDRLRDAPLELPEVAPSAPLRLPAEERAVIEDPPAGTGGRAAGAAPLPEALRQERAASSAAPATGLPAIGINRDARDAGGAPSAAEVTREADPEEGLDLIVGSLPVLRVEWIQVSPGRPGLLVLQGLMSGDTLEIRFVRSGGAAADSVDDPLAPVVGAPLPPGWSQVVREHRDGWLVARARLAREDLELLVDRVGVPGP